MRLLVTIIFLFFFSAPVMADEAVFAGGCFWCMEHPFDQIPGVSAVYSGFAGGEVKNPTYKQVSAGGTGHKEVVQVIYDPEKVSYQTLLDVYWRNVDPFDPRGQFCDKGDQYQSAIFAQTDEQRKLAEASKAAMEERFGKAFETKILPAATFYQAEGYHQHFYKTTPYKYKFYRTLCGRDARLKSVWGDEAGGEKFQSAD